ncbi:MAG: hypothetical protein HY906_26930 [Deltaproteobacteria bacterium]|nr:hypothetical protein [Deltaproteobacteria bacterium]
MRKAAWGIVCVVAGGLVALGLYAVFRVATFRMLPHRDEMRIACGARGAAAAGAAPAHATAAQCTAYFDDVNTFHRSAVIQTVISGVLAAFIFLVLRLRVYPLAGPGHPRPPPATDPESVGAPPAPGRVASDRRPALR